MNDHATHGWPTNNALVRVFNGTPINRQAGIVASQKGCVEVESDITSVELLALVARLSRKMRLLKVVLHVSTQRQHKNLVARYNAGRAHWNGHPLHRPKRIVGEYVRVGASMQILNQQIADLKVAGKAECQRIHGIVNPVKANRRRIGAIENAWKASHPAWAWNGQILVAENGDVFDRKAHQITPGQQP